MNLPIDLINRLSILDQIYTIYNDVVNPLETACHRGCAHCCTRNVSMTTLEGYGIIHHLLETGSLDRLEKIDMEAGKPRFQPQITVNLMAKLCRDGSDLPEEPIDPAWGPCPVLQDNECSLYAVRPFGCRSLVSSSNCAETGCADMDPFIITANTVFQQVLEHIDVMGCFGNFTDILRVLRLEDHRKSYERRKLICQRVNLLPNRPLKLLMVPPEHRDRIQPIIQALSGMASSINTT